MISAGIQEDCLLMHDLFIWDDLLARYVDGAGRVDYGGWLSRDRFTLRDWLARQTARTGTRHEFLAHWINLYNAFTIQAVLEVYPITSIRPTLMGVPNWIAFLRFFQRSVHRIGTESYSLSRIEHEMLRRQGDPRIHFAIVCASVGCPLLRNRAYRPELVEQQLEDDLNRFLHDTEKVRFDSRRNILFCSKIFRWYRSDFLQVSPSLPSYILARLKVGPRPRHDPRLVFLPYDWSLNQRISS